MLDKIRKIKINRLSEEERWFLKLIDDIEINKNVQYRHIIYFEKNGITLFQACFDTGVLRMNIDFMSNNYSTQTLLSIKGKILNLFNKYVYYPERTPSLSEHKKLLSCEFFFTKR